MADGLDPVYKRNSPECLVDFRELESLETMSLGWVLGSHFSNGLWYRNVLRVLGWILGNWEPFKDTRLLSHVNFRVGT